MTDLYCIDLKQISLEQFRHMLESKEILPGRRVLLEDMDRRFAALAPMRIETLADLRAALRTKEKRDTFARKSGLAPDYLVVLRREANSYVSRPFSLDNIPGVDPKHVERLAAVGVKHTKHLFARALSPADRAALAERAGVPYDGLLELVKLSDLARIVGVGPVSVRLLYDAGVETPETFLTLSVEQLLDRVRAVDGGATATRKDMEYCLETARHLPKAIDYSSAQPASEGGS